MHLKLSSGIWWPFCLGLDVLTDYNSMEINLALADVWCFGIMVLQTMYQRTVSEYSESLHQQIAIRSHNAGDQNMISLQILRPCILITYHAIVLKE